MTTDLLFSSLDEAGEGVVVKRVPNPAGKSARRHPQEVQDLSIFARGGEKGVRAERAA